MSLIDQALLLHRAGDLAAAEGIYRQILAKAPADFDALHLLGVIAGQRHDHAGAKRLLQAALEVDPDDPGCLHNLAYVLSAQYRFDAALTALDKALEGAPGDATIQAERGRVQKALARYDEATASFEAAVALDPASADAHLDLGICRLLQGNLAGGWSEYEWRWQTGQMPALQSTFHGPAWTGEENIAGKTVLIHAEQGLGDSIQFSRYAALLAERGTRVILEVPRPLAEVLAGVSGVSHIVAVGDTLEPGIDFHCPLMSLPLAFGTRLDTIPAPLGYVKASLDLVRSWSQHLGPKRRPRIALVWGRNAAHLDRTIGLERLLPLRTLDADLFGLQTSVRPEDQGILDSHPDIRNIGVPFPETAALISLMDLVVTIDTSIAHLAGALGAPTFVLLPHTPDWRWLLNREDSPWYPTVRLFRQPRRGDWAGAVDQLLRACRARFTVGETLRSGAPDVV
ncbi:tetratricopeptide repeat protein [Roseixanthobacter liquoris]|uniref:tetratricopeptide repeat protein n=1 Tax=Roseixanthobacter liquoris TaxID=3119921 RepID=UPI0037263DD4